MAVSFRIDFMMKDVRRRCFDWFSFVGEEDDVVAMIVVFNFFVSSFGFITIFCS